MPGLIPLFAIALAILVALLTTMLVRGMVRPPRHAAGYAMGRGMAADPGELGLEFTAWSLDRPDGAVLPVWEIATGPGRPPRTAVLVHGWGHGRVDSLARIKVFLPHFDRIVLYDLRGHGDSSGGLSRLGDGEDDDLLALLDRLDARGPFVLVGHSMGAVIALNAAIKRPEGIAGIIAYGAYCEFHRSLVGRLRGRGMPTRPITDLALLALRAARISPLGLHENRLARLEVPVLIVHGQDDAVSPLAHGLRIARSLARSTWHPAAGQGHNVSDGIEPQAHAALVDRFLNETIGDAGRV